MKYFIYIKVIICVYMLFCLIYQCISILRLKQPNSNKFVHFINSEVEFGSRPSGDLNGYIVAVKPLDACTTINDPPSFKDNQLFKFISFHFFALINKGNCSFIFKLQMAQSHGYIGVIFVNTDGDDVYSIKLNKSKQVDITSIMIGNSSGENIRASYNYQSGYLAEIIPNSNKIMRYYTILLITIISLILIVFVSVILFRNMHRLYKLPKLRLSLNELNKLRLFNFTVEYRGIYDLCPICLEDYVLEDNLRTLPCNHTFHSNCVDKWLLNNRRSCPTCKYWIDNIKVSLSTHSSTQPPEDEQSHRMSVEAGDYQNFNTMSTRPRNFLLANFRRMLMRLQTPSEEQLVSDSSVDDHQGRYRHSPNDLLPLLRIRHNWRNKLFQKFNLYSPTSTQIQNRQNFEQILNTDISSTAVVFEKKGNRSHCHSSDEVHSDEDSATITIVNSSNYSPSLAFTQLHPDFR